MCHEHCDHSTVTAAATDTGIENHERAPQAHISLAEINSKNNFRAEGALTFECQNYGTLFFAYPRIRQIMPSFRATEWDGAPTLGPSQSLPDLAPQPLGATRC